MIVPIQQPNLPSKIKLLPQEQEGTYQFNGRFVATRAVIERFGEPVIFAAYMTLLKEAERKGGLELFAGLRS